MRRLLTVAAIVGLASSFGGVAAAQESALSIGKGPDLQAVPAGVATDVTWTITVGNGGDTALSAVTVADEQAPACGRVIGVLGAGESITFECALAGIVLGGTEAMVNTATVTAVAEDGSIVSAADEATVVAVQVAASGIIGDTVWDDLDGDGARDDGEPGIPGVELVLTDLGSGAASTATTNADGRYLFAALDPGTYRVELAPTPGGRATTPSAVTVTLADGQTYLDADFGLMRTLPVTGAGLGPIMLLGLALAACGASLVLRDRRAQRRRTTST